MTRMELETVSETAEEVKPTTYVEISTNANVND